METGPLAFTVPAPSTVLITGGYLVISPENTGLVLSTDARCHCKVSVTPAGESGQTTLRVKCSQLGQTHSFQLVDGQLSGECDNGFIQKAVRFFSCAHKS